MTLCRLEKNYCGMPFEQSILLHLSTELYETVEQQLTKIAMFSGLFLLIHCILGMLKINIYLGSKIHSTSLEKKLLLSSVTTVYQG